MPDTNERGSAQRERFTQGVWAAECNQGDMILITRSVDEDHEIEIASVWAEEGMEEVCEEDWANARLITAAPDLYSALKLYVEHFGDPLKVARPALAKALGEE
jgi:hypothetical protein